MFELRSRLPSLARWRVCRWCTTPSCSKRRLSSIQRRRTVVRSASGRSSTRTSDRSTGRRCARAAVHSLSTALSTTRSSRAASRKRSHPFRTLWTTSKSSAVHLRLSSSAARRQQLPPAKYRCSQPQPTGSRLRAWTPSRQCTGQASARRATRTSRSRFTRGPGWWCSWCSGVSLSRSSPRLLQTCQTLERFLHWHGWSHWSLPRPFCSDFSRASCHRSWFSC
mmetsp:Transcript_4026/g.12099  ORF Transcript_4026/g.12099 Transcript_4026/m.12099 type:complete len:223 (+) Transcript_4026:840-1508(+)